MTAVLYLIRHGQTAANVDGISQGQRDVPLNALGRLQADRVGARFEGRQLHGVFSSPSSRAGDVAAAIAGQRLAVTRDPRLAELDQGELDGLSGPEMRERHQDFLERWRTDDAPSLQMPGGESLVEAQARIVESCEQVATEYQGGEIAVVSHNLALRGVLCHALGIPLRRFRQLTVDLAGVSAVTIEPGRWWRVDYLNDQCHLDGLPVAT